jgi:lysozyme family protein
MEALDMADFKQAFERTMHNEGGYKLHTVKGDRGGQTFAGISRRFHPDWSGWRHIDYGDLSNPELTGLVMRFYQEEFWERINGEAMQGQGVAETIYDFAVNAGPIVAIKLAQVVVGTTPDGIVGPETSSRLNQSDSELFHLKYALAKVARYAAICNKDPVQKTFLLGWINRTLKELS